MQTVIGGEKHTHAADEWSLPERQRSRRTSDLTDHAEQDSRDSGQPMLL